MASLDQRSDARAGQFRLVLLDFLRQGQGLGEDLGQRLVHSRAGGGFIDGDDETITLFQLVVRRFVSRLGDS